MTQKKAQRIGIVGAMPEEMDKIINQISHPKTILLGDRLYYEGTLNDLPVVAVFSRWGKVAAATTISTMILHFQVTSIVFTGIAGGLSDAISVGDIVVAEHLFQHDMDARPLMRRFEIPLTGKTSYQLLEHQVELAMQAAHNFLFKHPEFRTLLAKNGILSPQLHKGDIASGDLLISSTAMREALNRNIPSALCADMESAAAAQVCADFQIPLTVIRIISDDANEHASTTLTDFVLTHGSQYTVGIILEYLELLK